MRRGFFFLFLMVVTCAGLGQTRRPNPAEVIVSAEQEEFLRQSRDAVLQGDMDEALRLATRAVMADQTNFVGYHFRGELNDRLRRFDAAVLDFGMGYQYAPHRLDLLRMRARAQFKAGRLQDAISDWKLFVERQQDASQAPYLFTLGIAQAIVGDNEAARKQFEWYDVVQSNDAEAAAWHFLAVARHSGLGAARERMLEVSEEEKRIPMMQVYSMFKGELRPGRVLAAARSGEPAERELARAMFYADLYLGIFYEATGEPGLARLYLRRAEEAKEFGDMTLDYMREVARVFGDEMERREAVAMEAEMASSPEHAAVMKWRKRSIAAGIGVLLWLGIRLYPWVRQWQPQRGRRRNELVEDSTEDRLEREPELVTSGEEGST